MSPEEVRPLVENYLHEMAASWKMFLRQLRMPGSEVDQIEGFSDYSISCLTAGLEFWVKHANAPTYKQIARVLRGNVVTNYPLARKVEEFAKNKCQGKSISIIHMHNVVTVHIRKSYMYICMGQTLRPFYSSLEDATTLKQTPFCSFQKGLLHDILFEKF